MKLIGVMARRKRFLVVATGVLLAAAGTLAWRWWSREPGNILIASGTIEATEVDVTFKIPGQVIERPVEEGDRLEPGALVGRLESQELEAEVERLRATHASPTQAEAHKCVEGLLDGTTTPRSSEVVMG